MIQTTSRPIYRHQDGGLYLLRAIAKHTETGESLHIYEHLWPFEFSVWARPSTEWSSRFTPITEAEYDGLITLDIETARANIIAAKAARRQAATIQG